MNNAMGGVEGHAHDEGGNQRQGLELGGPKSARWSIKPKPVLKPGPIAPIYQPRGGRDVDNPHQKITGYRYLTQDEIDLMNEGKALAEQVGAYCQKLKDGRPGLSFDQRWLAIGITSLQQGFMAVIRSIAKPTTF